MLSENEREVIRHYDLLIDENCDPMHDPAPLRDYMNGWDGEEFIRLISPTAYSSVLEVGIGTGRLAARVAPMCRELFGIDISEKTADRAAENLADLKNVTVLCGNILTYEFDRRFDIIYSSLTFMHIKDKSAAIRRIRSLLTDSGRFILSIDKSEDNCLDYGSRKIRLYPDNKEETLNIIHSNGFRLESISEAERAWMISAVVG